MGEIQDSRRCLASLTHQGTVNHCRQALGEPRAVAGGNRCDCSDQHSGSGNKVGNRSDNPCSSGCAAKLRSPVGRKTLARTPSPTQDCRGDIEVLEILESIASDLGGIGCKTLDLPISKNMATQYLNTRLSTCFCCTLHRNAMEAKREAKENYRLGLVSLKTNSKRDGSKTKL